MKNQPFLQRLRYALAGIGTSWQSEKSFRSHIMATLLVFIILGVARAAAIWWAMLLLTCGLILALELINTAVEKLADHLHPDIHPELKIIKDTLAGAVLLASMAALGIFAAFAGSYLSVF